MDTTGDAGWRTHPWVSEDRGGVRFGIVEYPGLQWSAAGEWAQRVEELGFDSFWVTDHPAFSPDCWTRLAVLAGATRRLRLGPLVCCAGYRAPLVLARQAADLDQLSGGRLILGLGIGDSPREFELMGLVWGSTRQRQAALEETVVVVKRLLRGEKVSFQGQSVRVEELQLGGVAARQQLTVPILIAGGGERVTLRQVAEHADASNFGPGDVIGGAWDLDTVRRKFAALRAHCDAIGRPYDSVLRTYTQLAVEITDSGPVTEDRMTFGIGEFGHFRGTPRDAVAYFRGLVEAGVRYFIINIFNDPASLRLLAHEVLPELSALGVSANYDADETRTRSPDVRLEPAHACRD